MKKVKEGTENIMLCLAEVLIGVLLLINPIGFTSGIIMGIGCLMIVIGVFDVIRYFRMEAREAALSQTMAKGLIEILAGVFCAFNTKWFVATFPVLTILYGLIILITGLMKVQVTVDMLRLKYKRWYLAAINAVLSVICAVIVLKSPFTSTAVLWMFTGISLIIEAVFDVVTLIMKKRDEAIA